MTGRHRALDALFDPRSIAVVGASADPSKWGYAVAVQALRGADRHAVLQLFEAAGDSPDDVVQDAVARSAEVRKAVKALVPAQDAARQVEIRMALAGAQRSLGDLERCRATLLDALELLPPDATAERIRFAPGVLPTTIRYTNRPSGIQQVLSFDGHRSRR